MCGVLAFDAEFFPFEVEFDEGHEADDSGDGPGIYVKRDADLILAKQPRPKISKLSEF